MKYFISATFLFFQVVALAQVELADFNYNLKKEYNADTVQSYNYGNEIKFDKIVIDGFDSRVPFFAIQPNNPTNKFVILLHGLGSSKDGWIYPISDLSKKYISLKDSLLRMGYSVIIPDAKFHGERSYEAGFMPPAELLTPSNLDIIDDMWITTVKDLRLIMDYVEFSYKNVSSFQLIGYSMGGMLAIMLNSADDRFDSVVACVAPLDIPKVCMTVLGWNDSEAAESLGLISPENYAHIQLSPIYLLMGESDFYYTKDEAHTFYKKISIDKKKIKFYDSGHYLPSEFIADAINWITKYN